VFWNFLAIAVAGALGIKVVASAKVARARGTKVLEEIAFGWTTARLLGIPATTLFYSWFYAFLACGIASALH